MTESAMTELLSIEDIATMHRCTVRHARDMIVKKPGFPPEAPTSTRRNRFWLRSEVRAYINRKTVSRANPAQIPHNALQAA